MKTPDIYQLTDGNPKIRVLVDADVWLEFYINRNNFVEDTEKLYELLLDLEYSPFYEVYTTSKSFLRICYELGENGNGFGEEVVADLETKGVKAIPIDKNLREKARTSSLRDFDSAEEVTCANAINLDAIITLNPQNFYGANLPVWSVSDFWNRVQLQKVLGKEPTHAKVCTEEKLTYAKVCTEEKPTHAKVCTEEKLTHAKVCTEEKPTHAKVCTEEKPTHAKVCTEEKPTHAKVCTEEKPTQTYQTSLSDKQLFFVAIMASATAAIVVGLLIDD